MNRMPAPRAVPGSLQAPRSARAGPARLRHSGPAHALRGLPPKAAEAPSAPGLERPGRWVSMRIQFILLILSSFAFSQHR